MTRADRNLNLRSLDDPRLKRLTIGVQMVGNDATNTPPAHALARRGITRNVRGFMLYGDYAEPNPPAKIIQAVEDGAIDAAIVWGPLAGYFAAMQAQPLTLTPVTPWLDDLRFPMVFDISMGVRHGDEDLQRRVDAVLDHERPRVRAILASYHVPIAPDPTEAE